MNVLKNMEIIFTVTLALACSAAYVSTLPEAQARGDAQPAVQTASAAMPTVVVSAKRLTPAEKRASLLEEQRAAGASSANI